MFDQVLSLVKQHIGGNPEVSSAIPGGKEDEVHQEIANGVNDGLKDKLTGGGIGEMLTSLTGGSGPDLSSTISKAVANRLNGKFGLSADAIHKITSAIPGIVQKMLQKG